MTIYEELIRRVSDGETFHINFEKRTMKVGNDKLIDEGKWDDSRQLIKTSIDMQGGLGRKTILDLIESLYRDYRNSLPSERSDNRRRKYFKALSIEEIPDEQLMFAETREISQARLEGFILCMILEGQFIWDEKQLGKWFYQSVKNPDLVILRSWIENKNG